MHDFTEIKILVLFFISDIQQTAKNFIVRWSLQIILFAWATIERHILIFHNQWLSTKIKRIFLHCFPMIFIVIYCFIYYLTVVVFLSCDYMNDQSPINGVPFHCLYGNDAFFLSWDLLCHRLIPTMIIVISSSALLVRILYKKKLFASNNSMGKTTKNDNSIITIKHIISTNNYASITEY